MRAILLSGLVLAFAGPVAADDYVKGHVRKDGTYVPGHYRTSPNNTKVDNYSTRGNVNPYTGKKGSVDPYASVYSRPQHARSTSSDNNKLGDDSWRDPYSSRKRR